jgi:hypothetical protein
MQVKFLLILSSATLPVQFISIAQLSDFNSGVQPV